MLLAAHRLLALRCSVMFFPEGTRSGDGRVGAFNQGAFHLAIKAGVPVLPLAVEGTRDCLPKKSWKFGPPMDIRLRVLPPVETAPYAPDRAGELTAEVRRTIIAQIASWRGVDAAAVDGEAPRAPAET